MSENNTTSTVPSNALRNTAIIGGGMALIGIGLAAGIFMRAPHATVDPAIAQPASMAQASSANQANANPAQPAKAAHKHVPSHAVSSEHRSPPSSGTDTPRSSVLCSNCGVVDSVRVVQQRGEGSGLGAVTGGVLGGVIGNQMGKGQGKSAMTILGALGGGLAGNEVEKRARAETIYEVQVRMDDGSVRTFTQPTEPSIGSRVETDGQTFHVVSGAR